MDLDELVSRLETLVEDHAQTRELDPGRDNVRCEDCDACNNCRFCIGCVGCDDCTHCVECIECVGATQCSRCVSCKRSSHLLDCRDCVGSRYLTLCVDCVDCTHCLGSVGLRGEEFFVLNQQTSRKQYFELLEAVKQALEERTRSGWRPPVIGLESVEEEVADEDPDPDLDEEGIGASDDDVWETSASETRPRSLARGSRPAALPVDTRARGRGDTGSDSRGGSARLGSPASSPPSSGSTPAAEPGPGSSLRRGRRPER
jgi:hypothetical protein